MTVGLSDAKGKIIQACRLDSRPETILNRLLESLKGWKVLIDEIDSLAVVAGPGSSTALRTSLTIANTLSFVQNLPMASICVKSEVDDQIVLKRMAKAKIKPGVWSIPHYGSKPMITKPNRAKVAKLSRIDS